jgi:hypothetical protein
MHGKVNCMWLFQARRIMILAATLLHRNSKYILCNQCDRTIHFGGILSGGFGIYRERFVSGDLDREWRVAHTPNCGLRYLTSAGPSR